MWTISTERHEGGGGVRRIIDSHVHLGLLYKYNPERIDWLIARHCTVISWAFGGNIASVPDLKEYLRMRGPLFGELRRRGLACYHLCGIHPRKIPADLRPEAVAGLLAPVLEDPHCLGIGEIGLETGSAREEEILCAQVAFGLSLKRPELRFGIHTPRQEKTAVTARLLDVLSPYEAALSPVAVIDHCTPETLGEVLLRGYHAGITLSRTKSSLDDLIQMLGAVGPASSRIMCNTDSGREFYEELVLASQGGKIERHIAEDIFCDTARRFFGVEGSGH